jgi:hypothetical protein
MGDESQMICRTTWSYAPKILIENKSFKFPTFEQHHACLFLGSAVRDISNTASAAVDVCQCA